MSLKYVKIVIVEIISAILSEFFWWVCKMSLYTIRRGKNVRKFKQYFLAIKEQNFIAVKFCIITTLFAVHLWKKKRKTILKYFLLWICTKKYRHSNCLKLKIFPYFISQSINNWSHDVRHIHDLWSFWHISLWVPKNEIKAKIKMGNRKILTKPSPFGLTFLAHSIFRFSVF